MITRTPTAKKRRADDHNHHSSSLVIYEDSPSELLPLSPHEAPSSSPSEQMLCTFQCRQMVKSEFLDNLGSAEKQVRDYQTKLEAMNDALCKTEAERKNFKDQFCCVEQELAAGQGREKALQEQLMKEVTDSQEKIRKQIQSFSELENNLITTLFSLLNDEIASKLNQEARKLKSSRENSELLKAILLEEKGLEDELMSWKSIANAIPGISCAQDVAVKFAGSQIEVIENMTKVGEVSARLKQMEAALEVAELGKLQTESEAALAKEKADQAISEVKRLESM
ncbi:hypothetical protein MKW94_017366, partial [Papaver nudicaule]|nr:hypothetical protein [Papaver nudicaule]